MSVEPRKLGDRTILNFFFQFKKISEHSMFQLEAWGVKLKMKKQIRRNQQPRLCVYLPVHFPKLMGW